MKTKQIDFWSGDFGKQYTNRNTPRSLDVWNQTYKNLYGTERFDMFNIFIGNIPKESKILEVGCNVGIQLRGLQRLGFTNLYGIELQSYAVERAKQISSQINIIQGSAFDIPFKNDYFDLVMTNGVLIHIAPNDLPKAISEIVRCTKQYVLGFEYYSETLQEVNYRGNQGFLWKMDFAKVYQDNFNNLNLIKEIHYPYLTKAEQGNVDTMFLLEKC
ncbi:MAG: pseudaminic acid biosynthesis-associated methylase [Bernardetiaceae bacterium]